MTVPFGCSNLSKSSKLGINNELLPKQPNVHLNGYYVFYSYID